MRRAMIVVGVLCMGVVLAAVGAEEHKHADKKDGKDAKDPLSAAFERLKKLAGEWELAKPSDLVPKGKVALRIRLTGGGTAVAETIFPDTNMEMLSVYHRDGEQLVMTHYCCVGNQPRMRAKMGKDQDELIFEFVGGTNLNPAKDAHIHGGRIRFVDADHIHSEWEFHVDGKVAEKHTFDLVRKK